MFGSFPLQILVLSATQISTTKSKRSGRKKRLHFLSPTRYIKIIKIITWLGFEHAFLRESQRLYHLSQPGNNLLQRNSKHFTLKYLKY